MKRVNSNEWRWIGESENRRIGETNADSVDRLARIEKTLDRPKQLWTVNRGEKRPRVNGVHRQIRQLSKSRPGRVAKYLQKRGIAVRKLVGSRNWNVRYGWNSIDVQMKHARESASAWSDIIDLWTRLRGGFRVKLKRSKVTSNESIRAELISTPLECNNFRMVLEGERERERERERESPYFSLQQRFKHACSYSESRALDVRQNPPRGLLRSCKVDTDAS